MSETPCRRRQVGDAKYWLMENGGELLSQRFTDPSWHVYWGTQSYMNGLQNLTNQLETDKDTESEHLQRSDGMNL